MGMHTIALEFIPPTVEEGPSRVREEIAQALGLRPGTVMSRLSRARKRLAEMAGSRLTPDSGRWNDKKYPTKKPPEAD